jgi:hypothetical protein
VASAIREIAVPFGIAVECQDAKWQGHDLGSRAFSWDHEREARRLSPVTGATLTKGALYDKLHTGSWRR